MVSHQRYVDIEMTNVSENDICRRNYGSIHVLTKVSYW